jgi:hypothetical protein
MSLGVDLKTSGATTGMLRMVRMKDKRKQIPAGRETKDRQRRRLEGVGVALPYLRTRPETMEYVESVDLADKNNNKYRGPSLRSG